MPTPSFRRFQPGDATDPERMGQYIRDLETHIVEQAKTVESLKKQVSQPKPIRPEDLQTIKSALEAGGSAQLNLTNLPGVGASPVDVRFPLVSAHPDPVTSSYDTYILLGAPNKLYQIDRTVNPPVAVQLL